LKLIGNQGDPLVQHVEDFVTKVSDKQFKVTFAQAPTNAQTISIISV
jgi:hypothetical protein